jgi:predicted dehydrogenase
MFKTALIGLGDISAVHIAALAHIDSAHLIAVCDIDAERRTAGPEGAAFYTDYRELLANERPDVVHICLPHHLHYQAARDAAEAGCHIFAEKPLALTYAEGLEFARLEDQYQVCINICLQNRLNPSSEALMEALKSGAYGALRGVRGVVAWKRTKAYYEAKPWRGDMCKAGGGNMINQALHTLDLMQYFAQSRITRVKGSVAQLLDYGIDVEDTAAALIHFENGASGFFTGSNANCTDVPAEIEAVCEKAVFTIRYQTLYRRADGIETVLAHDIHPSLGKTVYGSSHEKLIARFYRALETGAGDYIHPQDALPVTWLIEAIRKSSDANQAVYP